MPANWKTTVNLRTIRAIVSSLKTYHRWNAPREPPDVREFDKRPGSLGSDELNGKMRVKLIWLPPNPATEGSIKLMVLNLRVTLSV